jgi:hypothetical protein
LGYAQGQGVVGYAGAIASLDPARKQKTPVNTGNIIQGGPVDPGGGWRARTGLKFPQEIAADRLMSLVLILEGSVHFLLNVFEQVAHILAAAPGIQVKHAGQRLGKSLLEIIG